MNDDRDLVKVKNEPGEIHPVNLIADYCFGRVCEDHFNEFRNSVPLDEQQYIDKAVSCFKRAIELGLTLEMSLNGGKDAADIWDKVLFDEMMEQDKGCE